MAITTFDVTPEDLKNSAAMIRGKKEEFISAYNSIYTAVSDLRVSFKGQTSETFNQRLEGYRNDFEAAKKTLENYAMFLEEYAEKMSTTEIDLAGIAGALSIGQ